MYKVWYFDGSFCGAFDTRDKAMSYVMGRVQMGNSYGDFEILDGSDS